MIPAEFSEESFQVYKKYQIAVHHDKPEKLITDGYTRFLVTSPLTDDVSSPNKPPQGYGSFHMQYRLDGKIVAVGVVDVLPLCLSSVYLYYDPDFAFLSLGVYSALKEISWVQEVAKTVPDLHYYYMGYYIHSCPKMKYKGDYHPSYLLCPETFTYIPIADAIPHIEKYENSKKSSKNTNSNDDVANTDISKNSNLIKCGEKIRFNFGGDAEEIVTANLFSEAEMLQIIKSLQVLFQGRILHFDDFMEKSKVVLKPQMIDYIKRVGKELALRMVYGL